MDPPKFRKKREAKDKKKSKGKVYSQKHVRHMTDLQTRGTKPPATTGSVVK